MGRRDTTFHDTTFATIRLDDGSLTWVVTTVTVPLFKKTGRGGDCPVSEGVAGRVSAETGRGFVEAIQAPAAKIACYGIPHQPPPSLAAH